MDDIIVIILTLVVAVVGIFNQQRKKKAAQSSAVVENKKSVDFWDMFSEETGGQEEVEPYHVESDEVSEEPEIKQEYQFVARTEGSSDLKKKVKVALKKKTQAKIEGEDFSLRKAVIYSEILNRKYS